MSVRIRVMTGPYGKVDEPYTSTQHPTEDRMVRVGDVFDVNEIDKEGHAAYGRGCIHRTNFVVVGQDTCVCPMPTLLAHGCQCGAIARYED